MHLRLHKLFDPVVRFCLADVELFGANDDAEEGCPFQVFSQNARRQKRGGVMLRFSTRGTYNKCNRFLK